MIGDALLNKMIPGKHASLRNLPKNEQEWINDVGRAIGDNIKKEAKNEMDKK